jgi:hypothetical protein
MTVRQAVAVVQVALEEVTPEPQVVRVVLAWSARSMVSV